MTTRSEQRPQARAVAAQPALVLAVVRAALLYELPEALRVIHDIEVRDLVLDHIGEHGLWREQEAPAEAHCTARRAACPATGGIADLQLRVGRPCAQRRPVQALGDLDPRPAPVPADQRVADGLLAVLDHTHVQRAAAAADTWACTPRLHVHANRQSQPEVRNLAAILQA